MQNGQLTNLKLQRNRWRVPLLHAEVRVCIHLAFVDERGDKKQFSTQPY
jgi:hypothetical protein